METPQATHPPKQFCDAEKLSWIRLSRSQNIGPLTFERLIHQFRYASRALEALPELARLGGKKSALSICSEEDVLKEIEAVEKYGAQIILSCEPLYSTLLREIPAPPPLITVKGKVDFLSNDCFAVVGARNASLVGKKMATDLSNDLGQSGWTTVSGLARGVDTCVHESTLRTGTIAVLAGGIDNIYPSNNEKLYLQIAEQGLIVAESSFGTEPKANLFPRRNRIISGLSQGTLVIEAALKSGSLVTARYALDQGRDVFAVPGSPLDPRARGTNHLIRQGAILTESYEDIAAEISTDSEIAQKSPNTVEVKVDKLEIPPDDLTPLRKILMENLTYTPIRVDNLLEEYHIPSAALWPLLLELEIAGRLNRQPGGYISLKPKQDE